MYAIIQEIIDLSQAAHGLCAGIAGRYASTRTRTRAVPYPQPSRVTRTRAPHYVLQQLSQHPDDVLSLSITQIYRFLTHAACLKDDIILTQPAAHSAATSGQQRLWKTQPLNHD